MQRGTLMCVGCTIAGGIGAGAPGVPHALYTHPPLLCASHPQAGVVRGLYVHT